MYEQAVGTVQSLYRYPVKSMLGETHERLHIDRAGVKGDRAIALIDKTTGKLVTAKHPVLWKAMLKLKASLLEDGTTLVQMPTGEQFSLQEPTSEHTLSAYLGRPVLVSFNRNNDMQLERADPLEVIAKGTNETVAFESMQIGQGAPDSAFVDYGPIHLIATSSLNQVGNDARAGFNEPERFRANLIIDTNKLPPYCENHWIGGTLCIGEQLVLKIVLPTPRCAVPTLEHGDSQSDKTVLAPLLKDNTQPFLDEKRLPSLGVYAEVVSGGVVVSGDTVNLKR